MSAGQEEDITTIWTSLTTSSVEVSTGGEENATMATSTMSSTSLMWTTTTWRPTDTTTGYTTTEYWSYDPFGTASYNINYSLFMLGFIVFILVIMVLKQCYRRSRFKSSDTHGPPGILHPVTPQGQFRNLNVSGQYPTAPTAASATIYHEEPPAYDTAIEMGLPSYEEIASTRI